MEKSQIVLDLSKWNLVNDYSLLIDGIAGVILRLGYRSYEKGIITEDPKFKTHYNGLRAAKRSLGIGIYFLTAAITEAEAKEEADWVVDYLAKNHISLTFPIAVDTEYGEKNKRGRADKLSKDIRTNCVIAFCERIKEHGYRPMIYSSDDWFVSQLDYPKIKPYLKWVARYSEKRPERVKDNIIGWQKTDDFPCKGIKTGVDMSEWYGPIKEEFSKLKSSEKTPIKEQAEEKKENNTSDNKIVAGDVVQLKNEPLYKASTTETSSKNITGTYYYWDNQIKEGKIRVTTKKEYVGVTGKVTGWISVK